MVIAKKGKALIVLNFYVVALVILFFFLVYTTEQSSNIEEVLITEPTPPVIDQIPEIIDTEIEETEEIIVEDIELKDEINDFIEIEISRKSFNIEDLTLEKGTTINWINKDERIHKIACYKEKRIFTDKNLNYNEVSQYKFEEAGNYLCVDAIFGLRQNIEII